MKGKIDMVTAVYLKQLKKNKYSNRPPYNPPILEKMKDY